MSCPDDLARVMPDIPLGLGASDLDRDLVSDWTLRSTVEMMLPTLSASSPAASVVSS